MRNSSYIHCERSISRQRTTPWIAGIARRRRERITEIASGRSLLQAGVVWRVIRPALNSERRERHGGGSLLLGRDDHGEAAALLRAVAGIRIADMPHGNLHVRKGANKRHQMGEDLNRIMFEITEA